MYLMIKYKFQSSAKKDVFIGPKIMRPVEFCVLSFGE